MAKKRKTDTTSETGSGAEEEPSKVKMKYPASTRVGPEDGRYLASKVTMGSESYYCLFDTWDRTHVRDPKSGQSLHFVAEAGVLKRQAELEAASKGLTKPKDSADDFFAGAAEIKRRKKSGEPILQPDNPLPGPEGQKLTIHTDGTIPQPTSAGETGGEESADMAKTPKTATPVKGKKAAATATAKTATPAKGKKVAATARPADDTKFKLAAADLLKSTKGNQQAYCQLAKELGKFTRDEYRAALLRLIPKLERTKLKADDESTQMVWAFIRGKKFIVAA